MIPYLRSLVNLRTFRNSLLAVSPQFAHLEERFRDQPEMKEYLVYAASLSILGVLVLFNLFIRSYPASSTHLRKQTENTEEQARLRRDFAPLIAFFIIFVWALFLLFVREVMRRRRPHRAMQYETLQSQIMALRRVGGLPEDVINRLNLLLRRTDFTGDDYEILQSLDANITHQMGASQQQIERLPSHVVTREEIEETRDEQRSCSICLAPYEEGQAVRTVACFHQFHRDCIDVWLTANPTCPICKAYAVE